MRALLLSLALLAGGCLPHTQYVPQTPGKAALAIKGGKLAMIKDGRVVNSDGFEDLLRCDERAAADGKRAHKLLKSGERNASIGGAFNALTVIFPLAPAIGSIFIARGAAQESEGTAAMIDAMNRQNDAPTCTPRAANAQGAN